MMSSISRLMVRFPQQNEETPNTALDAAEGSFHKASEYLRNHFGPTVNLNNPEPAMSITRTNVAERRLRNPAFRQPLKPWITKLNLDDLRRKMKSGEPVAEQKYVK